MPIIFTEAQDLQDQFSDTATKMLITFIIIAAVIISFIIIFVVCMFSRRKSTMGGNVKEGEKSVYFSGYGKAKKNTKKEKQIKGASSKSTKVCKMCGKIIPDNVEICPSCGSNEFQV